MTVDFSLADLAAMPTPIECRQYQSLLSQFERASTEYFRRYLGT
jgi:hypothetical protein